MRLKTSAIAIVGALFVSAPAYADTFLANYEAPGVQNSTATFSVEGVETFDSLPTGYQPSITTDFGTGGAITGVYTPYGGNTSGVQINAADEFGGAGGVGNHIVAFPSTSYELTLTADPAKDPAGINYFGYWLSALDAGNVVTFYRGDTQVYQVTPADVIAHVGAAYYGNPNPAFLGQDSGEPFAFINFYDLDGTFDRIVFTEVNSGGGYESDNHTVGFYTQIGGVVAAPELSTWAMLALGFAALGFAAYRAPKRKASLA